MYIYTLTVSRKTHFTHTRKYICTRYISANWQLPAREAEVADHVRWAIPRYRTIFYRAKRDNIPSIVARESVSRKTAKRLFDGEIEEEQVYSRIVARAIDTPANVDDVAVSLVYL